MVGLGRIFNIISMVLFLVAAAGHFIGLSGNPQELLFWGLAFFAAGHVW